MKLHADIKSMAKTLLLKSGTEVSAKTLDKIVKMAKKPYYAKVRNSLLFKDLRKAFGDARYKIIFSPASANKKVINAARQTTMPRVILSELADMKRRLPYTYHHILIITALAGKIALDRNFKGQFDIQKVLRLGLVHDIGKSRIPTAILNKKTALTRKEREIIKTHPLIGFILLHYYYGKVHKEYDYASYEHHERLDGSGYPRKLKKINKYAQLIAVVDTLDALLSCRPYRKTPYTLRAAIDHLLSEVRKGKINKKAVFLLISYARKNKPEIRNIKISRIERDNPPKGNVYGKTAAK